MNCLRLSSRTMMYRLADPDLDEGEPDADADVSSIAVGMDLESVLPFLNRNIIGSLMVACPRLVSKAGGR
jgi:hypothetical protein